MKKFLLVLLVAFAVIVGGGIVLITRFAGIAVKKGVETVGPDITRVETSVDEVDLSLFSGEGSVKGVKLGNPSGFKEDHAFYASNIAVSIDPFSLLSDKIVIEDILIDGPDLRFEQKGGSSNLNQIMNNIQAYMGPSEGSDEAAGKKLEIRHFLMSNSKVTVNISDSPVTITLPDIELKNLGSGSEGMTGAEVATQLIGIVINETIRSIVSTPAITIEGGDELLSKVQSQANEVMDTIDELKELFDSMPTDTSSPGE